MSAGYEPSLLAATEAAEQNHFWYRARREIIIAAVASASPGLANGGRMIEVGCGNGGVLAGLVASFPEARVIGLERFREGAMVAHQRTSAPTAVCDIASLPVRGHIDVIGAFDVIEHLDDDEGALREMRAALHSSGSLLLTVPAHPRLWSDFDEASGHRRRYTVQSLSAVVARAGFEVRYVTPFMTILYAAARVRRRHKARPSADPASVVEAELQVSAPLNAMLYRLLRQEARVVARRGRLPTGTSLLCEAVPR
jgi:SAM-dependent methyltransferase